MLSFRMRTTRVPRPIGGFYVTMQIPTSPDEIRETTQRWLTEYAKDDDEFEDIGVGSDETGRRAWDRRHHMRVLSSADDFVTTNLSTPEEVCSMRECEERAFHWIGRGRRGV